MASIIAKINTQASWTSAGTGDTLTCSDISPSIRDGVQLDVNGFNIDGATVVVTTQAGAEKTVAVPASTGESALIGDGFSMTKIVVSGIAAGTYTVKFSQ